LIEGEKKVGEDRLGLITLPVSGVVWKDKKEKKKARL